MWKAKGCALHCPARSRHRDGDVVATDHIYEIRLRWANIHTQPSTFSAGPRRLGRGKRFVGRAMGKTWVQKAGGGYIRRAAVRDLGEYDVTNEQMQAAAERFSAIFGGDTAAGDLLEALAARAQVLVTQATGLLMERLDDHEARIAALEQEAS